MARAMMSSTSGRWAYKDSRAIKAACKVIGIGYTYKAINEYLKGGSR